MNLLSELQDGPKTFSLLAEKFDKAYLDCCLPFFVRTGKVQRTPKGYCLPLVPEPDKPMPKEHRKVRGKCRVCKADLYRKNARWCSVKCLSIAKTKPRRPCRTCGEPVRDTDHIFCSRECRSTNSRGRKTGIKRGVGFSLNPPK